jgi:hypothetical protein
MEIESVASSSALVQNYGTSSDGSGTILAHEISLIERLITSQQIADIQFYWIIRANFDSITAAL